MLAEFHRAIALAIESGKEVDCVFLDMSKAFDKVDHSLLLRKLECLNIHSDVLAWIGNYLDDRKQCVLLKGCSPNNAPVTSGVPQGSVLGPLIFLTYINDIRSNISSRFKLFADDCVIYRVIEEDDDYLKLQLDLDQVSNWCSDWRMELNAKNAKWLDFRGKSKSEKIWAIGLTLNNSKEQKIFVILVLFSQATYYEIVILISSLIRRSAC